jgi:hypothetical protein
MTTQKSFKRRVRARMTKTGESYAAARRQLLPDPEPDAARGQNAAQGQGATRRIVESSSEEALRGKTGKGWADWFALLDEWGAMRHTHTEIASWLVEEHAVPGWWAQSITVGYEQERGMRQPGQRRDGTYSASASKTVAVPVERLYAAVAEPGLRQRWLDAELTPRGKSTPNKVFRAVLDGAEGRVEFSFTAKGPGKSQVAIEHARLPDAESATALKAWWRERIAALKDAVEA